MSILVVSHNIFLTKEERYAVIYGQTVKVIGISIPIWAQQGNTTEPAREIFCNYTISNSHIEKLVSFAEDGYTISLPYTTIRMRANKLPDEAWLKLSRAEQEIFYEKNPQIVTARCLLDPSDGGGAYMKFKYRCLMNKNNNNIATFHFVEIKTIESLIASLS